MKNEPYKKDEEAYGYAEGEDEHGVVMMMIRITMFTITIQYVEAEGSMQIVTCCADDQEALLMDSALELPLEII